MKIIHLLLMSTTIATAFQTVSAPLPLNTSKQNTISNLPTRFNDVAQQCSNGVHPNTLQAVARVESGFNPYAIGVVKGKLQRQPRSLAEAVATAKSLHAQGKNFSMGLMQVNRYNLASYGLNYETVFEPCKNINAGAKILKSCFDRAGGNGQVALQKAFSCYYSGNFKFGFKSDFKGQPPYVSKIIMSALDNSPNQAIRFSAGSLKVNHTATDLSKNQSVESVPPIQQAQRQPETAQYIPISAEYQNAQPPVSDKRPVVVATQKPPLPPPEWDVFAYAEYREKYGGNKSEWDISP